MAFQHLRPFPSQLVGSANSWPLPRRTGISRDFQRRAVSTAEPRPRTLPPIDTKLRPGNRKVPNAMKTQPVENSWARKWATQRSRHSTICDKRTSGSRSAKPVPVPAAIPYSGTTRSHRQKKEIVVPSEKEVAVYKRLQAVYGNTKDRVSRVEKLRESLSNLQERMMHSEINASLQSFTKKVEEDKKNRAELKRVRDRYSRDKERRNRYSFVSLNALETPQVPRKAYGLPDNGQEFQLSGASKRTQNELRNIWQKSMRHIAIVQGLVKLSTQENGLPKMAFKQPPRRKRSRQEIEARENGRNSSEGEEIEARENGRDSSEGEEIEGAGSSVSARATLEVVMGEIDAICTVNSDSEDDLSDIAEEGV